MKDFLFRRPDWFKHEGYWRLAQVFRIGPTVFGLVMTVLMAYLAIFEFQSWRYFQYVYAWVGGTIAYLVSIHFLIRMIVWIVDGFKSSGKPA